jgi:cold shock CspA family protein
MLRGFARQASTLARLSARWVSPQGFGFLRTVAGEEFFVHISNVKLRDDTDTLVEGDLMAFNTKTEYDGRLQAIDCVRHVPTGDGDGDGAKEVAAAGEQAVDFELLSELFEMKADELPEVLWYLSVFLRAVGYEDGLQGRVAVQLLKSLGRMGKVRPAGRVLTRSRSEG